MQDLDTRAADDQQALVRADDFKWLWGREKEAGLASEEFLWRLGLGRSECNALLAGRHSSVSAFAHAAVFDALYGAVPAPPPYGDRQVGYTLGNHHLQTLWPQAEKSSWAAVLSMLTRHEQGAKEGTCFVPAIFRGFRRHKADADEIGVLVLDCDDGRPLHEIEAAVRRSGWTVGIASTHSNLTTRTEAKASNLNKFQDKHPGGSPTQFLIEEKGLRAAVAADAKVQPSDADPNVVEFHHSPCPKFRVAFLLAEPWRASDFENQDAANATWAVWVRAVAASLGLAIDESCVDPSRLFFLPRYPPGGEHVSRVFHGEPCDPRTLPPAAQATTPAATGTRERPVPASLHKWAHRFARRFKITSALRSRTPSAFVGYVADEKRHHIECPFSEDHTSASLDRATFVCDAGESRTEGFAIHCRHAHCAGRDRLSFVAKMLEDGWLDEADLNDERFLLPELDPVLVRIDEMNERYAVVQAGGRALIVDEEERADGSLDVSFKRPAELRIWFANQSVSVPGPNGAIANKKLFDFWLNHSNRRQYERVELAPEGAGPQVYNLWRGFAVVPSAGRCDLFLRHLHEVVCRGVEDHYAWLLAFFAQMVQSPGNKPGVAVVLRGGQGTGKSIVGKYVGGLFPAHHVEVSRPDHLVGRFNAHHQKALLIQVEEAFWAGDKSAEGVLKHLITADTSLIEPKGVDPFAVRSIARLLITSNASWVVPAGPDERRYAVFDVSDARQQDTVYFAALSNEMENGGRAALLSFLRGYDLSKIDLRKIPKTEALLEQKLANLPPHAQWWLGCLREGAIGSARDWPSDVPKDEMYRLYGDFVRQQRGHQGYKQNEAVFFKELLNIMPLVSEIRLARTAGRRRVWVMPDLSENRRAFERWINQPINWDL